MTIPAPWSLPLAIRARIMRDLRIQAALQQAATTFNYAHVGERMVPVRLAYGR